jgi:hypothetical protein
MTTPNEQSNRSESNDPSSHGDELSEPELNSLESLTDGRDKGYFQTRYPFRAWLHISLELFVLVGALIFALHELVMVAISVNNNSTFSTLIYDFGTYPDNHDVIAWLVLGLSGFVGGLATSLKWLYHTVAKHSWNRDRTIWRLIVPGLSAVLATFSGMMISAGLLPPIFNMDTFSGLIFNAGFGFFLGLFSDNLLASLQRLAVTVFGVVDKATTGNSDQHKPKS